MITLHQKLTMKIVDNNNKILNLSVQIHVIPFCFPKHKSSQTSSVFTKAFDWTTDNS